MTIMTARSRGAFRPIIEPRTQRPSRRNDLPAHE